MSGTALIGIDLGGTNCRAALLAESGEILRSNRIPTRVAEGREQFLSRLFELCDDLLSFAEKEKRRVLAVGMGAAGVIAEGGVVTVSPNVAWLDGFPLAETMAEGLRLPVTVVNDANAVAWGEAKFGAGRNFASFLTITLGTGVGGGLVLERRLWKGSDGAAGEIGHFVVDPGGRPCKCGSRGCLERYASATGMVCSVIKLLEQGKASVLKVFPPEELTAFEISRAARSGDAVALRALQEAGERLGQVLASVANLLNLDGVVICGGPSASLDLLRPWLEAEMRFRTFAIPFRRMRIVRGELGDEAGIVGAACLACDAVLQ